MAKAIKPKDNVEVLELEAEEIPLDKQIENTLVKHNVTAAVIAGLKEKYGGMKLAALDDKESFLEIKQARKEVRQWGILCERITKKGREDAVAIQRKWLEKEKSVLAQIAEVQDPLDAEIKKYEDEIERKETEAANRREEAFIKRQSQLLKMGATYENGLFNLNHVGYEMATIKDSDDEIWTETILPKYQREYEKNEAVRVAEEKRREEAAESLRIAQEEMTRKQKEMDEREAAFKLAEEQRVKAESENKRWRDRLSQIDEVGWNGQYAFPKLGSDETKIFTYDELVHLPDDVFNARLKEANDSTAAKKREIEEKKEADRREQLRIAEEAAAQRERDRIAEEQRQAKEKERQEEARKAEEALKAKDSEKWQVFVAAVTGVAIPEMKSPSYKNRVVDAQKLLQKITML